MPRPNTLAIHFDMTTVHGSCGEAAGLEEAYVPQPLVYSLCWHGLFSHSAESPTNCPNLVWH